VLAEGANNARDAVARAEAVMAMRGSEDFIAVSAAFKRMKNILAQAKEKGFEIEQVTTFKSADFPSEEQDLLMEAEGVAKSIDPMRQSSDYVGALQKIATLRPAVDRYFDKVMILDPNPTVRRMRLGVLRPIVNLMSGIADFSEIVTVG
jgi:glycyl-tRNA synthetase beta chain